MLCMLLMWKVPFALDIVSFSQDPAGYIPSRPPPHRTCNTGSKKRNRLPTRALCPASAKIPAALRNKLSNGGMV